MNRPKLLLRLIRYYDSLEFRGHILIGDSSSADIFREVGSALEEYKGRLSISHSHLPGYSVSEAVLEMTKYLCTPYVCLVPDDDFIVPAAIDKCIKYLAGDADYVGAHGLGILISSTLGASDTITDVGPYPQSVANEATAANRLSKHLANYSVSLFSVYRSEIWRKMFMNIPRRSEAPLLCDKAFADELLPCCLSVVYGKIKQVDGLYLIRQAHGERYLLPAWFTWLSKENWRPSYLYFRNQLAIAVSSEDKIALDEAENLVDSAFSLYLKRAVIEDEAKPNWLRQAARKSRILRWSWRALREMRARVWPAQTLSLSGLLRPSSPYSTDFLPIFSAVTRTQKSENHNVSVQA